MQKTASNLTVLVAAETLLNYTFEKKVKDQVVQPSLLRADAWSEVLPAPEHQWKTICAA